MTIVSDIGVYMYTSMHLYLCIYILIYTYELHHDASLRTYTHKVIFVYVF